LQTKEAELKKVAKKPNTITEVQWDIQDFRDLLEECQWAIAKVGEF
jgi:hypothetical protein